MAKEEMQKNRGGIIAFRASAELIALIEVRAASEGISKSDVARRVALRGLAKRSPPAVQ